MVAGGWEEGRREGGGCGIKRVALGVLVIELLCISTVVTGVQITPVIIVPTTRYTQAHTRAHAKLVKSGSNQWISSTSLSWLWYWTKFPKTSPLEELGWEV